MFVVVCFCFFFEGIIFEEEVCLIINCMIKIMKMSFYDFFCDVLLELII